MHTYTHMRIDIIFAVVYPGCESADYAIHEHVYIDMYVMCIYIYTHIHIDTHTHVNTHTHSAVNIYATIYTVPQLMLYDTSIVCFQIFK